MNKECFKIICFTPTTVSPSVCDRRKPNISEVCSARHEGCPKVQKENFWCKHVLPNVAFPYLPSISTVNCPNRCINLYGFHFKRFIVWWKRFYNSAAPVLNLNAEEYSNTDATKGLNLMKEYTCDTSTYSFIKLRPSVASVIEYSSTFKLSTGAKNNKIFFRHTVNRLKWKPYYLN